MTAKNPVIPSNNKVLALGRDFGQLLKISPGCINLQGTAVYLSKISRYNATAVEAYGTPRFSEDSRWKDKTSGCPYCNTSIQRGETAMTEKQEIIIHTPTLTLLIFFYSLFNFFFRLVEIINHTVRYISQGNFSDISGRKWWISLKAWEIVIQHMVEKMLRENGLRGSHILLHTLLYYKPLHSLNYI